ncbi:MAG: hypothetical protein FWC10_06595, partial [Lentimicrobiaceae bacterium]|nr:hypothetical protein [Lentimicrobiaceae bacterium]
MKKTIFLLAIIFIASFSFLNAQNAVYQTTDLSAIYSEHHLPFPDQERADCEMTYLGTDPSTQVGFPLWSNWYPTACISYTASQVEPYVGGKLTKIILAVPASEFFPSMYFNPSASKVYVKHSLSGAVVYEQTFNPVFDSWNTIVLNTPQTVSAGSGFVIGVQYSFSAACDPPPSPCETYIRPFKATTAAEDPAVPGGFYYICSNNASNYGAGATFQPITNYGNFGIKGYVVDCDFPENDMAALGVSFQEPSQWKEMKEYYTYSVGVKNIGTNPQNNFKVQLTDNNGNVLAEETITEQLAWGATKVVEFPYAHPIEGYLTLRGKVILSGDEVAINDISDPVTLLIYTPDLLKYIETQGHNGGFYIGGEISNAVGFPAAGLSPYAGKQLVGMAIDFWDARGFENYIHLWVRNSLDGDDLWFSFEFPKSGWNYIKIDPPIDLENKDIYFGWTGATTEDFISITHANGVPNPNGYWYKPVGGDWKQGVNSPDDQYNLCIVGLVKPVGTDPVTNL